MNTAVPTNACLVSAQQVVPGLDPSRVWSTLSTGQDLPAYASHLISVVTIGEDIQRWSAQLNGSAVGWTQRHTFTGLNEMRFEQLAGDFAEFGGRWTVVADTLSLQVQFDLGVDGLAPLLNPIWIQAVEVHCTELVGAVARAAGPTSHEWDAERT